MISCIYRGLKVFAFYLLVLSLGRLVFCLGLQEYWGEGTGWADVATALWLGFRLSIQTAGIMALITVIPAGVLRVAWSRGGKLLEQGLSAVALTVTSILFVASFPYYRQFHSRFNQLLFNAGNDDVYALFVSLVQEFSLPLRLAGALLLAGGLWYVLQKLLQLGRNKE